jgi:hypothetical protein
MGVIQSKGNQPFLQPYCAKESYKNSNPVSKNCGGMLPEKLLFMIFLLKGHGNKCISSKNHLQENTRTSSSQWYNGSCPPMTKCLYPTFLITFHKCRSLQLNKSKQDSKSTTNVQIIWFKICVQDLE